MLQYVMRNHSIPASDTITRREGGAMNKGFNWKSQCEKALKHKLQRTIDLARINITYQTKYPNEVRDNPEGKLTTKPHPEAYKRILEEHEKCLHNAIVPTVIRPARLSRVA